MDCRGRLEKKMRKTKIPKAFSFPKRVKRKSRHQLRARSVSAKVAKHVRARIDPDDIYFKRLLSVYPEMIIGFAEIFPQARSAKNDYLKTLRTAKSKSYASNYSRSPCSNGCYPLESEAVASGSSSSQSRSENAAEAYEAHNKKTAEIKDKVLYVAETNVMDEPQAYEHLAEHVNEIGANRFSVE